MAMNQTENHNLFDLINQTEPIANFNPNILKDIISKKTNRGRKSKNQMPQKVKCDICLEFEEFSRSPLIKCTTCHAKIHSQCYKDQIEDEASFTCERCQIALKANIPIESYHCLICNRCDGILYKQDSTKVFYHETCLKFIPELYEENENEQGDLTTNKIRRWRYKNSCKYCREKLTSKKSVIKCANPRCKCYYHIPCAIQKGMIFSLDFQSNYFGISGKRKESIPFFCAGHNKKITAAYRECVINQGKDSLDLLTDASSGKSSVNDNDYQLEEEPQVEVEPQVETEAEAEAEEKEVAWSSVLNLDFSPIINETKDSFSNEYDTFTSNMFIDYSFSVINIFDSMSMSQDSQLFYENL